MQDSRRLRAVTFDFHNTIAHCDRWFELEVRTLVPALLDWHALRGGPTVTTAMREEARQRYRELRMEIMEHGNELDAAACARHVLDHMVEPVGMSDNDIVRGIDDLMADTLSESVPVPGVLDAIRGLRAAGLQLGVISAAVHHGFLEWSLAQFGVRDQFDLVVTTASAGYYKTRPELYLTTVDALGSTPAETLHIGDSYRLDVLGAQAAGMHTAWFDRGDAQQGEDRSAASFSVQSMGDLVAAVQHLNASLAR